jgi:ketol-acid reductoisomerase
MRFLISETAKWGDVTVGPRIADVGTKKRMKGVLKDTQNGNFAKGWVREYEGGYKTYKALLAKGEKHPIEKTGAKLRSMMPWLAKRNLEGA